MLSSNRVASLLLDAAWEGIAADTVLRRPEVERAAKRGLRDARLEDVLDHVNEVAVTRWIDAPLALHLGLHRRNGAAGAQIDIR